MRRTSYLDSPVDSYPVISGNGVFSSAACTLPPLSLPKCALAQPPDLSRLAPASVNSSHSRGHASAFYRLCTRELHHTLARQPAGGYADFENTKNRKHPCPETGPGHVTNGRSGADAAPRLSASRLPADASTPSVPLLPSPQPHTRSVFPAGAPAFRSSSFFHAFQ